jgi:branched-chain amino acid transport system substrate-binding protein
VTTRALAAATLAAAVALAAGWTVAPSGVRPLPPSVCSPLVHGKGTPDLLIVSDLPLQGARARPAVQMAAAIRFVLARHAFRAGKYSLAYQSCDDANLQTGAGDLGRCVANAKAYAANSGVIGVIGTWSSRCSEFELPILNRARGGPLAIVSPSNTNIGLTRAAPGTQPGEPGRYYPTRKRNFVRLIAPDDAQGAAAALLVKQLRAKSVYVLDDKEDYGFSVDTTFRHAAAKLGLKLVGSAFWDPDASDFTALAQQVARAHPAAVYLAGFGCAACAELLKALRGALGRGPLLVAPDGWMPLPTVIRAAGSAAEGLYVSALGTTAGKLGRAASPIVRRFGGPVPGGGGPPYAAQAAEVLLAAIARSNGTRGSVTSELFRVKVRNGILGSFGFDKNGDTTAPAVTFYRARGGKQVVARVITPPPRLIR